jgi:hypothetical protein
MQIPLWREMDASTAYYVVLSSKEKLGIIMKRVLKKDVG